MRSLWRFFLRILIWDHDRGSLPYDLMVAAIVLFVFLSPRSWFHDQPQSGPLPHTAHVELLESDAARGTKTYRVDAHLLALPTQSPQVERQTHDLLGKNVEELKGRTFQIIHIQAVPGDDGVILYYRVAVKP